MLILLSPAKTLNFEDDISPVTTTKPQFLNETEILVKILKKKRKEDIKSLMSVSDKIAALNIERFKNYTKAHSKKNSRAALHAYRGDVYKGFTLEKYKKSDYDFAQKTLRIITGFYGILKPLDSMQPYRLEMKIKLKNPSGDNLYSFWSEILTRDINKNIKKEKHHCILNLASNEYSKAIIKKDIEGSWIDIDFKVLKGKELKTIGIYAKKARGIMANYIILHKIKNPSKLVDFSEDGYKYNSKLSSTEKLVFIKKV